jgi:hypothetical protein
MIFTLSTIPVAARSKAWVWGRSHAGIVGSNASEFIDVCLLWLLCVVRLCSLCRADHSSRGVLSSVVCLMSVIAKSSNGRPRPGVGPKSLRKKRYDLIVHHAKCILTSKFYTIQINKYKNLLQNMYFSLITLHASRIFFCAILLQVIYGLSDFVVFFLNTL